MKPKFLPVDTESWDEERMDIIGQNGPTAEHYLSFEEEIKQLEDEIAKNREIVESLINKKRNDIRNFSDKDQKTIDCILMNGINAINRIDYLKQKLSCATEVSVHDDVNQPKHYRLFPDMQAIDVIKTVMSPEEFKGYLKGNILKYRLRAGNKGDAQKDIAKADWYSNKLNEVSND